MYQHNKMKKSDDVGGREKSEQSLSPEGIVDIEDNNKTNGEVAVAVKENVIHPGTNKKDIDDDDDSDIIIITESKVTPTKTNAKDEKCSSESKRRSSTRLRGKRPKLVEIITTSDEDENHESDNDFMQEKVSIGRSGRKRNQPSKKTAGRPTQRMSVVKPKLKHSPIESKSKKRNDLASKTSKEFMSGAFVVLKTDFHASGTPAIWRIDGKALLQKYVHFDQDGQTLYKNTSTYSGWVANNKNQYYPVTVEFKSQSRKETVVKFLRDEINADDSD